MSCWILTLGALLVGYLVGRRRARKKQPPTVDQWQWHIHVDAAAQTVGIIRKKNGGGYDDSGRRWAFDAADDESRGEALSKARDYLWGIRSAERQAKELSR